MVNYRKLYENFFGITIPAEYDIHHIDFCRDNNEIDNLILLPHYLHQALHQSHLRNCFDTTDIFSYKDCGNEVGCGVFSKGLAEAAWIYNKLQIWAAVRECERMKIKGLISGPLPYSYDNFRKKAK